MRFLILDPRLIHKLYYENTTKSMVCCTKPYRKLTMDWMNCSSITECHMRQSACLTENRCPPTEAIDEKELNITYGEKEQCVGLKITDSRQEGFLRCKVQSVHKFVAQATVYYYNVENDFHSKLSETISFNRIPILESLNHFLLAHK